MMNKTAKALALYLFFDGHKKTQQKKAAFLFNL